MTTKWTLVPTSSTGDMDAAGRIALSNNGCDNAEDSDAEKCYAAMLTASPGADLLERIVRARDRYARTKKLFDLMSLMVVLDEIGGSNG